MTNVFLHQHKVNTVFDLLGDKENDITFSVGWAFAKSDVFLTNVLRCVFPKYKFSGNTKIYLQEHSGDKGFTDIEVRSEQVHLILEAKRGWNLPHRNQLKRYVKRFQRKSVYCKILVVAECSPAYAKSRLPKAIGEVAVVYMSWKQLSKIVYRSVTQENIAGKHLLRELYDYFDGLITMQNQNSNKVYVVSLGSDKPKWSKLSWVEFVTKKKCYFHPFGVSGWPKEPPNYLGFRYKGRLQSIHHIEDYQVVDKLSKHLPEVNTHLDGEEMFLYKLGPAILPVRDVKTGNIFRNGRVWAALDLLLTSKTISQARDLTKKRSRKSELEEN